MLPPSSGQKNKPIVRKSDMDIGLWRATKGLGVLSEPSKQGEGGKNIEAFEMVLFLEKSRRLSRASDSFQFSLL
jgi:hypothetical protein